MLLAQGRQRSAKLGSAGKVLYRPARGGEHLVAVANAHRRRKVGQLRPKGEKIASAQAVGGRVQEGQQQARVAFHRSRHIEQHQQRHRLALSLHTRQVHQFAAGACSMPHDARPVQARTAHARSNPPRCELRQLEPDIARQPLDQVVLGARQGVEVGVLEPLQVTGRHRRVELDLVVFLLRLGQLPRQRSRRKGLAYARASAAGFGLSLAAGQ